MTRPKTIGNVDHRLRRGAARGNPNPSAGKNAQAICILGAHAQRPLHVLLSPGRVPEDRVCRSSPPLTRCKNKRVLGVRRGRLLADQIEKFLQELGNQKLNPALVGFDAGEAGLVEQGAGR